VLSFLFIFGITLPFDLKDMENDFHARGCVHCHIIWVKTPLIPWHLYRFLFPPCCINGCSGGLLEISPDYGIPAGVGILIAGLIIHAAKKRRSELIYFFALDGTILLQFLLLLLFKKAA
jgi:hypothetical protein